MNAAPASKRRNMALLVGAIVLTLSVWFAGTAAVPVLLRHFSAGATMAGVYPVCMSSPLPGQSRWCLVFGRIGGWLIRQFQVGRVHVVFGFVNQP